MSDFRGALNLPTSMIAMLREMEHRQSGKDYEELNRISAEVMVEEFKRFSLMSDRDLEDFGEMVETYCTGGAVAVATSHRGEENEM